MAKLVSKTYGEALFAIAMEEDKADGLMEEVLGIREIIRENPEFDKFMKHPGISKQDKLKVMTDIFRERVSSEMSGFLHIVVEKERYGEIPAIFNYFIERMKEFKKIGVAQITTAVELSEIQKAQIKEQLLKTTCYRSMEVSYIVDPAIIGGMIIRIKDRVVDSSIRTRLNDLTKQLLQIQLG